MQEENAVAPRRPPRRRRTRRLLAVGVATTVVLGLAGPAVALRPMLDEGWSPVDWSDPGPAPADPAPAPAPAPADPAPAPVPAPEPAPAPVSEQGPPAPTPPGPAPAQGETAQQAARRQVDDALREAARMLSAYEHCLSYITGPNPGRGEDALTVLSGLTEGRLEGGEGKIVDHPDQSGLLGAPASVPESAFAQGSNGQIDLYKQFHEDPRPDNFYRILGDDENRPLVDALFAALGGPPTPTEWRALIILHELMHLTGNLPGDHGGEFAFEAINSGIFINCVRGGVGNSGGVGVGVGGSPGDVPQVVPLPAPPPFDGGLGGGGGGDLPTSDDPVIDDGSDAPVIIGEDGTVIGGGEIGEAYDDPPDPGDPYCYPDGCLFPDPGEPYDPGYGGGSDYDCCFGGGGGGDHYYPELDDGWYYYFEEFAY